MRLQHFGGIEASRWPAIALLAGALVGCQRHPPQVAEAVDTALAAAWAACAPEYAPEEFAEARRQREALQQQLSAGGERAIREQAEEATAAAATALAAARQRMASHRAAAEEAIRRAERAYAKAEASRSGRSQGEEFAVARRRLAEARQAASIGSCNYVRARSLAIEAEILVEDAEMPAVARLGTGGRPIGAPGSGAGH